MLLDYGQMFLVLPFGNATVTGKLTGAALLDLLGQGARKGALQPAGLRYRLGAQAEGRGAASAVLEACVVNRSTRACEPLDPSRTYRVGTNEFLAGGGDGYAAFRQMTDVRSSGDMLDLVNAWISARNPRSAPYRGPNGDGTLDGRISREPAGATRPPITR
jgi:5'-nucleotidase